MQGDETMKWTLERIYSEIYFDIAFSVSYSYIDKERFNSFIRLIIKEAKQEVFDDFYKEMIEPEEVVYVSEKIFNQLKKKHIHPINTNSTPKKESVH